MSLSPYENEIPKPVKNKNSTLGLVIVVLIGLLFASQMGWIQISNVPHGDARVVDKDPDKSDRPLASDTYVVRVYETKFSDDQGWLSDQIQNQKFWQVVVKGELSMGLESFDPVRDDGSPNPQASSFVTAAKNRDIEPPFWIHAHNGEVLSVNPFDKNVGQDTWLKIIKGSVK